MGVLVREKVKGSGVWWCVVNHKKRRKYVRCGSRDAAKAVARKIEEGLATGAVNLNPPPPPPTFEDYAEKWYSGHVVVNLKPSSQRGARLVLDKALLPAFGYIPIDKITRADIREFCARMLDSGRVRERKLPDGTKTKTLSRGSVSGMARTLSAIFNHAVEDGIIASNPAARPARYIHTGDRLEAIDILSPEEAKLLLETTKQRNSRFHPLLATALFTGMRQGELIALEWGDIDWHGKFIEVRRANWEGHISTPKSGKGRRVDLADHLTAILTEHRRTIAAEALKAGRSMPEWVFPVKIYRLPEGEKPREVAALDAANVRKVFAACLRKAGLRQIRFHDLRHWYASLLIGNGESLEYVKRQLGHASIGLTVDTYGAHVPPGTGREAVNRLTAMIENAPPARLSPETKAAAEITMMDNVMVSQGN